MLFVEMVCNLGGSKLNVGVFIDPRVFVAGVGGSSAQADAVLVSAAV